jgi:hypothetical protein
MTPNTVSCLAWGTDQRNQSLITASSFHSGGVNAVCVDGSVHFISDTIHSGDTSHSANQQSGESSFGVWGALGSIDGGEAKTLPTRLRQYKIFTEIYSSHLNFRFSL